MYGEFDLCKGLDGVFQWNSSLWFIKPTFSAKYNSSYLKLGTELLPHKIYFDSLDIRKPLFSCKLLKNKTAKHIPETIKISSQFRRFKRDTYPIVDSDVVEPNIIELLIVVTSNFFRRFRKDFRQYILSNVAIATKLLRHPTIKASFAIDIVDIVVMDEEYERDNDLHDWRLLSQDKVVNRFCQWVQKKKQSWNYVWDSAILINDGLFSSNAIGIAHLRSMCSENNCLAVVDRGFGTGFIIAHELAHQMNARHDFDNAEACSLFETKTGNQIIYNTIMSTSLFFENYPFVWSACSQNVINSFLKSKYSFCLKQKNRYKNLYPHESIDEYFRKYSTGVNYDLNEQCSFAFGEKAEYCETIRHNRRKCSVLYCRMKRIPICLRADAVIADGTECDENKHCIHGECRLKNLTITPIDGGWSEYSEWSNCSRPCNGGVEFSYRFCNNPIPEYGGRFCTGTKERIRSCNIQECRGITDPREESCMRHNLKPYIPSNDEEFACNLVCISANHTLKYDISLTDGTPCSPFRSDICVKGTCHKTGCDKVVGSKKVFDNCNICGGHNESCVEKNGFFDGSKIDKVRMIKAFTIPKNVHNLLIKKNSQRTTPYNKDVFDDFELLLIVNRRTVIRRSETIEPLAGGQLYYSGANRKEETIEIKGKINVAVSVVIKVENLDTTLSLPSISYRYYVDKTIFIWKYLEFMTHPCKDKCNGFIENNPACFRKLDNHRVFNQFCPQLSKPKPKYVKCSSLCGYRWQRPSKHYINNTVTNSCPVRCGSGKIKIWYLCERNMITKENIHEWITVDESQCYSAELMGQKYEEHNCIGNCNPLLWSYEDWEQCPIECGTSFRYRPFICKDSSGKIWQNEICLNYLGLPDNKETCISYKNCRNLTRWVTSPWSKCSQICEIEQQKRFVYCFRSEEIQHSDKYVDENFLKEHEQISDAFCDIHSVKPVDERPCSLDGCFLWVLNKTGKCSTTCGSGFKLQTHVCMKKTNQGSFTYSVDDNYCFNNNLSKPENYIIPCFLKLCFIESFWIKLPWNQCSVSCGEGIQQRYLKCGFRSINNTIVWWNDNKKCANLTKPITLRKCEEASCPKWTYSEWSECEGICEYGTQFRKVVCTDTVSEKVLPDSNCDIKTKQSNFQKCLLFNLCGHWHVGKWSQCSVSCGLGIKTRTVSCNYSNGTRSVDHSLCQSFAPFEEVHCHNKACSSRSFWWITKTSECYEYNCQPGITYASVRCVNKNFNIVFDHECNSIKHPNYYVGCVNSTCRQFFWVAESWNNIPCNVTSCMMKIRNRNVYCVDDYGEIHNDYMCDESTKLDTWRLCPSPPSCSDIPRSCKELKNKHPVSKDGEYSLAIDLNWTYSIYCAFMNTDEPKEYLTLKEPNYARSSKYTLVDRMSCVFDEEIEYDRICPTCKVDETFWSITYYDKVRINMSDLSIDVMDNRFSITNGNVYMPYGTAKDCSGSVSCPRGHFKIDLRGTGFSVSTLTEWNELYPKYGYRIVRKEGSQVIKGWCGGYCSGCSPLNKLFIEPQMYGRDYEIKSKDIL